LTLGVVLTLGGVTGGRGQELSSSVTAVNAPAFDGLALPALPGNWADLPFQLTASQTVSYNSNINAIPLGTPEPVGTVRADFTSATNLGFSTKANVYGQQLYLDTTFGLIRYLHEFGNNANLYSVSAGDNWTFTSRCSGNLGVTLAKTPGSLADLVASGINYMTSTSLNETGNCAVSNGYSLVFNGRLGSDTNSNPIDAINNSRTSMIEAGIEYAKGPSTLSVLAGITDTSYTARTAAETTTGLATQTDFHTFTLNYTREINANLSLTGTIGLVGVTNGFTLGLPKTLLPIYTLSTSWAFTPKFTLTASGSRTISPPTTVIANAEVDYNATVNLAYQMTPKVAFTVGVSAGYDSGAFTSGAATSLAGFFVGPSNLYSATAGLSYAMTPFLSAGLHASYTERVGDHLITPEDLVTINLDYRPY
jgi:hypothetical protein